jgi:hypothetical protein
VLYVGGVALADLNADIRTAKRGLREAGVPQKLLAAIETRALRSGRRQTGQFRSNRASRWTLSRDDPQYATETNCKCVLLRLFATLLEFDGAPKPDDATIAVLERSLGRRIRPSSFRDELTLEKLSYPEVVAEVLNPTPGISTIHIGHRDPTQLPRHLPDNIEWRTDRSNLIQGNLTLREARTKFVELIARYFELGEVAVIPDE